MEKNVTRPTMNLEKQESREEERRLEDKKIQEADAALQKEGRDRKEKENSGLMEKAGKDAYSEILSTRRSDTGSGEKTERAEFEEQAAPHLAQYAQAVRSAEAIKNNEDWQRALKEAYLTLVDNLEGIRGTQEGRDAEKNKQRLQEEKKSDEDRQRSRTLAFSEAILKAAKENAAERGAAEIARNADKRAELSAKTRTEAVESAKSAV
jgi:hypothetical protein